MDTFLSALSLISSLAVLISIVAGTIVGVIVGVLPGLGPALAVSLMLPFTFGMDSISSIGMLLGVYAGSIYGGSITAILLNTPGTPASAATAFDGYPMARKGKADIAIGVATLSSAIGGILSLGVLIFAAPQLAFLALKFGPSEMFAIALFALTCIAAVSRGAMLKGLIAGAIGLLLSVIGQDVLTGSARFTFGSLELLGGLSLVSLLVGLFAVSEVLMRISSRNEDAPPILGNVGFRLPSASFLFNSWPIFIKSTGIGTFLGILPGIGPTAASFVSYAETKRSLAGKKELGTGEPEGIMASESANNAVTGGALVPTLALGIPGDPITAIMLGALIIHDIVPGPQLFVQNGNIAMAIFLALLLVNLVILAFGALSSHLWTRVLRIPEPVLLSSVLVLVCVGVYSVNSSFLDLFITFVAGVVGFLLRAKGFPIAPIVIGFVLGPMIEENLRMGLIVYDNDVYAYFTQPITLLFIMLSLLVLALPALGHWKRNGWLISPIQRKQP